MPIRMGTNIGNYISGRRSFAKAPYTNGASQKPSAGSSGVSQSMKNMAFNLRDHGMTLADSGRNSVISKAVESGDPKEVRKEVNEFVEDYNTLIARLQKNGEALDQAHIKELGAMITSSVDKLKSVGIRLGDDGKLILDKAVLGEAKAAELQTCLQGKDAVTAKVATKCVAIGIGALSGSGENSIFGDGSKDESDTASPNQHHSSTVSSAQIHRYRAKYNRRV